MDEAPRDALEHDAETVRAWFAAARGGGTFLSPADGATLVGWLQAGVPVGRILRAIETTAARRRARRARTPFTLRACAKALAGPDAGLRRTAEAGPARDLDAILTPWDGAIDALAGDARRRLDARGDASTGARVALGCAIVADFQQSLRRSLEPAWPALREAAAAALEESRDGLDEALFAQLCEEWVRDRLRARYPDLTAGAVHEEAELGPAR
ncbi:MAG: hypothetical protein RLZZ299_2813 [Pseudomonadota bacterium]